MINEAFTINVPEVTYHKVCWETCKGGIQLETIYVVTPEKWNMEHEGFIGYILQPQNFFLSKPLRFVFDGLLYVHNIKESEVAEIIGKEILEHHKKRMKAIELMLLPIPCICDACGSELNYGGICTKCAAEEAEKLGYEASDLSPEELGYDRI